MEVSKIPGDFSLVCDEAWSVDSFLACGERKVCFYVLFLPYHREKFLEYPVSAVIVCVAGYNVCL